MTTCPFISFHNSKCNNPTPPLQKLNKSQTLLYFTKLKLFIMGINIPILQTNRNFVEDLQVKPLCYFVLYLTELVPRPLSKVSFCFEFQFFTSVFPPTNNKRQHLKIAFARV